MTLVGILTAIDPIQSSSLQQLCQHGGQMVFPSATGSKRIRIGGPGNATGGITKKAEHVRSNQNKVITFQEAMAFKERYTFPRLVSVSFRAGGNMTVYKRR